jgi:hypothetical protein
MNLKFSANIAIKANIYSFFEEFDNECVPEILLPKIPGDLRVNFLTTEDSLIVRRELSHIQHLEYEQSKHFQKIGQHGIAFSP